MSERFVIAVMAPIPHLICLEIAALLALRAIWRLPDWCLKVVVLIAITRRLHRSALMDASSQPQGHRLPFTVRDHRKHIVYRVSVWLRGRFLERSRRRSGGKCPRRAVGGGSAAAWDG